MSTSGLRMFCVDDDAISCVMLKSIFGAEYELELFNSAESCLARLAETTPDLLLLDVDLPGMDGFELCRQIKDTPATQSAPVIFVSGKTGLDMRLKGYEAGGEDFIHKPYSIDEVRRKVQVVRRALESAESLRQQLAGTEELSSLLLSNMDEYAVLIKFMRALNESQGEDDIAQAVLVMLRAFHLQGAVQLRTPGVAFTLSEQGRDRPLEQAIIAHMSTMDRIFEFNRRCVYNFPHISVLVNNMPTTDPDLCGRLRDHLAIAAEMADAKIEAAVSNRKRLNTESSIAELLEETRRTISNYIQHHEMTRRLGAERLRDLLDKLTFSFAPLGLSPELEEELVEMVHDKTRAILTLFDSAEETAETLGILEQRLERMLH